mmetsp:Transcript_112733/g.299502  ORF Transcript_112733/g.299502 Transcript_112733/m.299502 type:complete len:203 (-) Transcript_112733:335-943(-)
MEKTRPGLIPYGLPSDQTPMETSSPGRAPQCRSWTWLAMARAADSALLALRACTMLAPRLFVSWTNSSFSHCTSSGFDSLWLSGWPLISACSTSGAQPWLPQMITFLTSPTEDRARLARRPLARFWSRRVRAKKFSFGRVGAWCAQSMALVQAGCPTTRTLQSLRACLLMAWLIVLKIMLFFSMISRFSLPSCCGKAPSNTA